MTILITGASRGIGAALRHQMMARGDEVIGTARDPGPGAGLRQADMADAAQVARLADGIEALDLLVCNAGIFPDRGHRLDDGYPPEVWAEAFAVNVTGVYLTIRALLPALRAATGRVAIISSQMASDTKAPGGSYIYRASKAAVLNLGRNIAADLKDEGLAVGIFHPGWVRTDMGGGGAALSPDEAARGLIARFDALTPETTGRFLTWDGREHPF
jgi:NAD(P)-dependent dehydrogenase (short-subunit alcohol dehydrogenase family)